jgi:hypothetical protein
MPLRTLLPTRPGTDHRRHSSIIPDSPSFSSIGRSPSDARSPGGSLKRLSLSLSPTNEEPFPAFLTHESESLPLERPSTQPSPKRKEGSQSVPGLPITTDLQKDEAQGEGLQDRLSDLPLPRPQRLSLLGMRSASDSRLSSRFRSEANNNAVKEAARMCHLDVLFRTLVLMGLQLPRSSLRHQPPTRCQILRRNPRSGKSSRVLPVHFERAKVSRNQ